MLKKMRRYRGQTTTEYAVLLAIVASALIAMQVYFKRGIQGRIRDLADQISTEHYESGRTTSNYTINQTGRTHQTYERGVFRTFMGADETGSPIVSLPGVEPSSTPETITRQGGERVEPETRTIH